MIDWKFIAKLEGGRVLKGYVPAIGKSMSGVTIATGADLGACTAQTIANWPISDSLKVMLAPYAGLKGTAAMAKLEAIPLEISEAEAVQIETAVSGPIFDKLREGYDRDVNKDAFYDLPDEAQTALASLAYQYGPNLAKRTPKFWQYACNHQWAACVAELEDFGDAYSSRRRQEAALLRKIISPVE